MKLNYVFLILLIIFAVSCTNPSNESGKENDTIDNGNTVSDFSFFPSNPEPGTSFLVKYTGDNGLSGLNLKAIGTNIVQADLVETADNDNGTKTWTYSLSGLLADDYSIQLTSGSGSVITAETVLAIGQGEKKFVFNPASPVAGQTVTVKYTDKTPYVYVGVKATGPNTVNGQWGGVVDNGNGTWTWTHTLSGLKTGTYTVKFTTDNGVNIAGQTSLVVGSSPSQFSFNPKNPVTGQTVTVKYTDSTPYVYVGIKATGPSTVNGQWIGVVDNGNGTWTWTHTLSGLVAGTYTVKFTMDNGANTAGQTTLTVIQGQSKFSFNPSNPSAGQTVTVLYTDSTPYVYVGVKATGPNTVYGQWVSVANNGNGTWTWAHTFSGLLAGTYTVKFTTDNGANTTGQTTLTVRQGSNSYFSFNPSNPLSGQTVTVYYTDSTPFAYVGVTASGPNTVNGQWGGVTNNGNGTWTWAHTLSGLLAGTYNVKFTTDNGANTAGQTTLSVGGVNNTILNVPFISQLEYTPNGLYNGRNNCGPASLAMCIDAYGKRPAGYSDNHEFVHLVRYQMTGVPDDPYNNGYTDLTQMRIASANFYSMSSVELFSLTDVKNKVTQERKPVIVYLDASKLLPRQYAESWATDHIIVVTGFSLDGQWVYVNDPLDFYDGSIPNNGAPNKYTYQSFASAFKNWGLAVGTGL